MRGWEGATRGKTDDTLRGEFLEEGAAAGESDGGRQGVLAWKVGHVQPQ